MHPQIGYTDLHPDALRLTLVEGDLDRDRFHVFADDEVVIAGIRIRATIIGSSHVVTYRTGSFALHEIFACEELPDVSSWTVSQLTCAPVQRQLPGVHYEFSISSVAWSDPEPGALAVIAASAQQPVAGSLGVIQDFPQGELNVTPKTVIVGNPDITGQRVVIETAHSYPNDCALIMSRTVLRVA